MSQLKEEVTFAVAGRIRWPACACTIKTVQASLHAPGESAKLERITSLHQTNFF